MTTGRLKYKPLPASEGYAYEVHRDGVKLGRVVRVSYVQGTRRRASARFTTVYRWTFARPGEATRAFRSTTREAAGRALASAHDGAQGGTP